MPGMDEAIATVLTVLGGTVVADTDTGTTPESIQAEAA
jgi:hypothetical protein